MEHRSDAVGDDNMFFGPQQTCGKDGGHSDPEEAAAGLEGQQGRGTNDQETHRSDDAQDKAEEHDKDRAKLDGGEYAGKPMKGAEEF